MFWRYTRVFFVIECPPKNLIFLDIVLCTFCWTPCFTSNSFYLCSTSLTQSVVMNFALWRTCNVILNQETQVNAMLGQRRELPRMLVLHRIKIMWVPPIVFTFCSLHVCVGWKCVRTMQSTKTISFINWKFSSIGSCRGFSLWLNWLTNWCISLAWCALASSITMPC